MHNSHTSNHIDVGGVHLNTLDVCLLGVQPVVTSCADVGRGGRTSATAE